MSIPVFFVDPEHSLVQETDAILRNLHARGFSPGDVVNIASILAAHALAHVPPDKADETIMTMEEAVRQNSATLRGVLMRHRGSKA